MKKPGILTGSRFFAVMWIGVALGSCTVVQNIDSRSNNFYSLSAEQTSDDCGEFKRQIRLGHNKPIFPRVDITQLAPDEVNDVLLTYAEKLKTYIHNEETYVNEDILQYNSKCQKLVNEFFKIDSTYPMGMGDVLFSNKVQ